MAIEQFNKGEVLTAAKMNTIRDAVNQAQTDITTLQTNSATKSELSAATTGSFYGYAATAESLPADASTNGYAYVGTAAPYAIYNYTNGAWTNSGSTLTNPVIEAVQDPSSNLIHLSANGTEVTDNIATPEFIDDRLTEIETYLSHIDDEPTAGSDNLVKSGGIAGMLGGKSVFSIYGAYIHKTTGIQTSSSSQNNRVTEFLPVPLEGTTLTYSGKTSAAAAAVVFYDSDFNYISENNTTTGTITKSDCPSNAKYIRMSGDQDSYIQGYKMNDTLSFVNNVVVDKPIVGLVKPIASSVIAKNTEYFYFGNDDYNVGDAIVDAIFKMPKCELSIQRFNPTGNNSFVFYIWENGEKKSQFSLSLINATVTGNIYTWDDEYCHIVVDVSKATNTFGTSKDTGSRANAVCFKEHYNDVLAITSVKIEGSKYIDKYGNVKNSTNNTIGVTDFCRCEIGKTIEKLFPMIVSDYSYIFFYDSNFNFISSLQSIDATVIESVTLTSENIPEGAEYFRAIIKVSEFEGSVNTKPASPIEILSRFNTGLAAVYDYDTAIKMNRNELRRTIEIASNGKCTVIYDIHGYPSLMRRLPICSLGSLNTLFGDDNTPHPAFVVNNVVKGYIYIAVFMSSLYNDVPVSWPGLNIQGGFSYNSAKQTIAAKGSGWHLETIWERSLLSLLSASYHNTNKPTGNNDNGRSLANKFEFVEMGSAGTIVSGNPLMPGNASSTAKYINGTQPDAWSHDGTRWGVFDLIGGFHEHLDLCTSVSGKIYLCQDNYFGSDYTEWSDTGAYIALNSNTDKLWLDTAKGVDITSQKQTGWADIICSTDYDNIPIETRKKLALALVAPRISSSDAAPIYDFDGVWKVRNDVSGPTLCLKGGAQAYTASGLGYSNIDYDRATTHGNMGCRMSYIELTK